GGIFEALMVEWRGQTEVAGCGKQCHGYPATVIALRIYREERIETIFPRPLEKIGEPAVKAIGDEEPDHQKGNQLDHGFKGDCRDQPLVMLARIDMAGTEEDRKKGEDQRDDQGRIDKIDHIVRGIQELPVGRVDQNTKAGCDRFELERDIGRRADHGDDCDETAEAGVLAISRGDEIGDRGDAMHLADTDDLDPDDRPEHEHQCRTEIDGQKIETLRRGKANAPVKGPGGAIDRDRQGVDIGVASEVPALARVMIDELRDGEQQPEVKDRDCENQPAGHYLVSCRGGGGSPSLAVSGVTGSRGWTFPRLAPSAVRAMIAPQTINR